MALYAARVREVPVAGHGGRSADAIVVGQCGDFAVLQRDVVGVERPRLDRCPDHREAPISHAGDIAGARDILEPALALKSPDARVRGLLARYGWFDGRYERALALIGEMDAAGAGCPPISDSRRRSRRGRSPKACGRPSMRGLGIDLTTDDWSHRLVICRSPLSRPPSSKQNAWP